MSVSQPFSSLLRPHVLLHILYRLDSSVYSIGQVTVPGATKRYVSKLRLIGCGATSRKRLPYS